MTMRFLAAAVLLAGAGFVSQASAANIVQNGSFETGFTNWTLGGTVDSYPAVVIPYNTGSGYPGGAFGEPIPPNNSATNSPDAAGSHAAYFVSDFAAETLTQTVHLAAGVYQIGFSAYLPQNGFNNVGDAMFTGSIAGVTLANFDAASLTPVTWKTYAGSTTITTAGDYLVTFTFNTNFAPSKDVVIDQVYIVPGNPAIPEPASLAILGAGLAGLGLTRLRRRS
jgi:PEP-CTERM motif